MFQFLHLQKNLSFTETFFYLPFVTGLGVGKESKPVALADEKLQVQNNEGICSKKKIEKERKRKAPSNQQHTGTKLGSPIFPKMNKPHHTRATSSAGRGQAFLNLLA